MTESFQYSAFRREPSQIPDHADAVLDEHLVLMRAERFEARAAGLRVAAGALVIVARRDRNLAEEVLAEVLPWLTWLPETERRDCVNELLDHLLAGADTGELLPFGRALAAWRSSAVVWSDPQLARELQGPFPGDGPKVPRPGGKA